MHQGRVLDINGQRKILSSSYLAYGIKRGGGTSSNCRELRNLVETLEGLGRKNGLDGRYFFLCTDKMVCESIA